MTRGALFVITSDPRASTRPAEAVRIAAGVAAWRKVAVSIYLRGAAVLALSELPDDLADGDHFNRYLPLVSEAGGVIYAQRGASLLNSIGHSPVAFRVTTDDELAALVTKNDYLVHF
jgi:hypothetical protein